MSEIIEPQFDIAAQEARDLARRATPEPAIQVDMPELSAAEKPAAVGTEIPVGPGDQTAAEAADAAIAKEEENSATP